MSELSAEADRAAYLQRLEVFLASRDAGKALTAAALRSGIRLKAMVSVAADVAAYADEALAIVNDEYRPRLDCQSRCTYCCCKPGVLVTVPEFLRILDHVSSTFDADGTRALIEGARRYASMMEGRHFDDLTNDSVPCPLLTDGLCSVYEVRPLVCRGYNSADVGACRAACDDATVPVPIFAVLKDVSDGAMVGIAQSLQALGANGALIDLGTALHLTLSADEGFAAAVGGGARLLAVAENSTFVEELWAAVREIARQVGVAPEGAT
ncbi:MAG: YkgJ family cysteine cluster protein [Vicinamibacterales bacterium]